MSTRNACTDETKERKDRMDTLRKVLEIGTICLAIYVTFCLFSKYVHAEECRVNVVSSVPRRLLNSQAVRTRFTVHNDCEQKVVGLIYRIEFFDQEGLRVFPRGIGNSNYDENAISIVDIESEEYETIYSEWIANVPSVVTSAKVIVLGYALGELGRYRLTILE